MDQVAEPRTASGVRSRRALTVVAAAALVACAVTAGAMARTSATFDEIVLVSGGLRGLRHGAWEMVTSQPPVMMYLYGAAAGTASPPCRRRTVAWGAEKGWSYARTVFFRMGNDPMAFLHALAGWERS